VMNSDPLLILLLIESHGGGSDVNFCFGSVLRLRYTGRIPVLR
jgi:hypothetical protein